MTEKKSDDVRKKRLRKRLEYVQLVMIFIIGFTVGFGGLVMVKANYLNTLPYIPDDDVIGVTYTNNTLCLEFSEKYDFFYSSSEGFSMYPNVMPYAFQIFYRPTAVEDIRVGSVVLWKKPTMDYGVVHRVIEIVDGDEWYVITKGDNNIFSDRQKISYDDIKGILISVVY